MILISLTATEVWMSMRLAVRFLHTFGSLADLHQDDPTVVVWRYHLGKQNTFVPGLDRMAYISVPRFLKDVIAAIGKSLAEVASDSALNALFGRRLPTVYFLSGVLPSRDPGEIVTMDAAIDAEIDLLDGGAGPGVPIARHE